MSDMPDTISTQRLELGAPYFEKFRVGELTDPAQVARVFIESASAKSVRHLSAIWTATELEIEMAETTPSVLAALVAKSAKRPYGETLEDAMRFFTVWLGSITRALDSLNPAPTVTETATQKLTPRKKSTAGPSAE